MPSRLLVSLLASSAVAAAFLTLPDAGAASDPGTPQVVKWAGGFRHPVDLEWGADGHLYIAELVGGDVLKVGRDGKVVGTPVLHVDPTFGGERGLVGMALDPRHAGRIWVYYTAAGGAPDDPTTWRGENRLSWFEGGVERVVLRPEAGFMHNGGRIAFDSAGDSLFVVVGDAGDRENAQNLDSINGKVLRIDRDGKGVAGNTRGPVFSFGHRNMYGLAVDPKTGTVMVTENSNGQNDEINLIVAGGNYGWPHCEGNNVTDAREPCAFAQHNPLFQYFSTIAPTGGAWLGGDFWFGAFNKGDIHRVSKDTAGVWRDTISYHHPETPRILDVTPGPEGNTLYFSAWTIRDNPDDSEGQIWKMTLPGLEAKPWTPGGDGGGAGNDGGSAPPAVAPPASRWMPASSLVALVAAAVVAAAAAAGRRRR